VKEKFSSNPHLEEFVDVEDEIRSMTNEEGCMSLLSKLQEPELKNAHIQLCVLR